MAPKDYLTFGSNSLPSQFWVQNWGGENFHFFCSNSEDPFSVLKWLHKLSISKSLIIEQMGEDLVPGPARPLHVQVLREEILHWPIHRSACLRTAGKIVWKVRPSFFHFSLPHKSLTNNRGPGALHSTQKHTSCSFCQQRPDDLRQNGPLLYFPVYLFRRVSGIHGLHICGMSVKCFKTKNLQLEDLSREGVEVWGRYTVSRKTGMLRATGYFVLHLFACTCVYLHQKRGK